MSNASRATRHERTARRKRPMLVPHVEACERLQLLSAGVSLTGYAFSDVNVNNQFDSGEAPLAGATVTLFDLSGTTILGQATTDANGRYLFDDTDNVTSGDLQPGSYVLIETAPAGYINQGVQIASTVNAATPGATPDTINVTAGVSDGTTPPDALNFADIASSSISGVVYDDTNGNGAYNAGDQPVAYEFVSLFGTDSAGQTIDTYVVTGADGAFSFDGLRPGTYTLTNNYFAGLLYANSAPGTIQVGSGTPTTSGSVTGQGVIGSIVLQSPGSVATNYTFGEVDTAISGKVVIDAIGHGLDPSDAPQAGVKISLYHDLNGNGLLDSSDGPAFATKTTGADGTYRFLNPGTGAFIAQETVPTGYVRTTPVLQNYNAVSVCNCGLEHGGVNFANFPKPTLTTPSNVKYTITDNGKTTTVTDLRGKTKQGDEVTVTFTVKPGQSGEFSLVSYTAPTSSFSSGNANQQVVFRSETDTFGPGTYTMSVTLPNGFYQVDFVAGPVIDTFGGTGSNIFYSAQGRLISADNGGLKADGVSSLSGYVFNDRNHNGKKDSADVGIAGVDVIITGTDYQGNDVYIDATTSTTGAYAFTGLAASDINGYTISLVPNQAALAGYTDEKAIDGSLGGGSICTPDVDELTAIMLNFNQNGTGYNFAEVASC